MKRPYFPAHLLLIGVGILLTGCFEVVERLDLHGNGSGSFRFTVNMSRSKTRIASILQMKTINGRPVPSHNDITAKLNEITATLRSCAGISQVSSQLDLDNFIASVSCSFDKVENLNQAIRKIAVKQKAKPEEVQDNYKYDTAAGTFYRLNNFSLKTEYDKMKAADKEIFDNAVYTGIMRFEHPISASSHVAGKIAADKKAVMVRENILPIVTGTASIANTITLTK
ncbi:MAG: hypothetical protein QM664_11395 [Flavihumibacter sp.]